MKAVLFDLDDTLYPEATFVRQGFRAVARFLGPRIGASPARLAARLEALHERDGRGRLFDALLEEAGRSSAPELVLACVLIYRTQRPQLAPFPGVVEMLEALQAAGIRTGLVSDGLAAVQRRKLAALPGVARRLDVVVLTDELGRDHWKPSPTPFQVATTILDVSPSDSVYVANDPRKDFVGARAAGLQTIRTGRLPDEGGGKMVVIRPEDDADLVIDAMADLPPILTGGLAPARHG